MDFLNGKKTYLVAIMTGILAGLQAYGIVIPEWVYMGLGSMGMVTLRHGMSK